MATSTTTRPSLLSLPRELRDIIYDFAFSEVVGLSHWGKHDNTPTRCNAGLLLTCHQIHAEAINAYYTKTIFYTSPSGVMWYTKLPTKYRKLIGTIRVWTIDWKEIEGHFRAVNLTGLGHGVCAITDAPIEPQVLRTWYPRGEPSLEDMAEYHSREWVWVWPRLPYGGDYCPSKPKGY